MGLKCCVFGCANIYRKKRKGDENCSFLSFHRFPANPEIRMTWLFNVRQINGPTWQPINLSVVCSEHFDCSSWEKIREDGKRKLKFQAAPSIFNNLSQKSINDHNYSQTIKDITNNSSFSSMERNKLHSSIYDHTYSSKVVSSNKNLFTLADSNSMKETSSVITSTNIRNVIPNTEIESSLIKNENSNVVLNSSDVLTNTCTTALSSSVTTLTNITKKDILSTEIESSLIENRDSDVILNSSDILTNTCTTALNSSVTMSTNITKKDIPNTSEIESGFIDSENSDGLNNSDVLTNTCIVVSNAFKLIEVEVVDVITAETVKEQNMNMLSLKKGNEQLKKELARVRKIADKIYRENEMLRKSNKKLCRINQTLTNIQKKTDKSVFKIFNKDHRKAIYRKNYQDVKWEPETSKQTLNFKLKCGSSGYTEIQKYIPLSSLRTLQRKIKH